MSNPKNETLSTVPNKNAIVSRPMVEPMPEVSVSRLSDFVDRERALPLGWADKAAQPEWYGLSTNEVARLGTAVDDLSTPMMTLDRQAIDHNHAAMAKWCADAGVRLAPHGKTTMAPALWREQLLAGAWAITVANEPQLRIARGAGVSRIIVANLLLRPKILAWLSQELNADPHFEFFCWVDSVDAVRIMDAALTDAGLQRCVSVLVELGGQHSRTGVRDTAAGLEVARAVRNSSVLTLAGVAGYEGTIAHGTDAGSLSLVDDFLRGMIEMHGLLTDYYGVSEPFLCAGGSAYFDRVVAILGANVEHPAEKPNVVIRSGAYLVQDDGFYRESTPSTRGAGPTLKSAMHVWARVISLPEPGLALLDAGKRDVPYDERLPEVQSVRRTLPGGGVESIPLTDHSVFATNDQHSYARVPTGSPLRVGDVVRLGLSHPCTAFDKWALIPVIDSVSGHPPTVIDLIRTYF